uniref:Uncharacterized protein n=1 Tax=Rhizophora mucronata TaxID=61149 RepID=A0A2P2KL36_RHIMU
MPTEAAGSRASSDTEAWPRPRHRPSETAAPTSFVKKTELPKLLCNSEKKIGLSCLDGKQARGKIGN